MINFYSLILCVLFLNFFSFDNLQAQTAKSNRGKDFWLCFLPNYHNNSNKANVLSDSLYVFISSEHIASGKIYYTDSLDREDSTSFVINNPNQVYKFGIPWLKYELQGVNRSHYFGTIHSKSKQTFHVVADTNVTVYALNQAETTSDAAMILPVDALANQYFIMSYPTDARLDNQNFNLSSTPSEFAIIATEDNTQVVINAPMQLTNNSQNITVNLNKGEVYLVQAEAETQKLNVDLTGSEINSDKAIAVFAGHQRALLPIEARGVLNSRDHLYEQMIPVSRWGKEYLVTPFQSAQGVPSVNFFDLYRIVASEDNTEISFSNSGRKVLLNKGQFWQGDLTSPVRLLSTKPILVAIYKRSTSLVVNQNDNYLSDPLMIIVPPAKQYLNNYTFSNIQIYSGSKVYLNQLITIISLTEYIKDIRIDGNAFNPSSFISIPNTCYSYINYSVSDGVHNLQSSKAVGLYVMGYGMANSYGYLGGMSFEPEIEIFPTAEKDTIICLGDSVRLSTLNAVSAKWDAISSLDCFSCLNPIAKPLKTTVYYVDLKMENGCYYRDSVIVEVRNAPQIQSNKNLNICYGDSIQLNVSGADIIQWLNPEDLSCSVCPNPISTSKKTIKYKFQASSGTNCFVFDSILLNVNPLPQISKSKDTILCIGESAKLSVFGANKVIWDNIEGLSDYNSFETIAKPNTSKVYKFKAFSTADCAVEDSIKVSIVSNPIAQIRPDTSICSGAKITIWASGGVKYKWTPSLYLECDTCASTFANPIDKTTYTVTVYNENDCQDIASVTINTFPCPYSGNVNSLVYSPISLCDNSTLSAYVKNTGYGAFFIKNVKLSGDNPEDFSLLNLDKVKVNPLVAGDSIALDFAYNPSKIGISNVIFDVITNIDTLNFSGNLEASSYKTNIKFKISPDTTIIPGSEIEFVLSGESNEWDKSKITKLTLSLLYNMKYFDFRTVEAFDKNIEIQTNNKSINSNSENQLDFVISKNDNSILNLEGLIAKIKLLVLLADTLEYRTNLKANANDREICTVFDYQLNKLDLDLCVENLRLINLSKYGYKAEIKSNNSNNLILDFSQGIEADCIYTITDIQGRTILNQINSNRKVGEYVDNFDLSNFANGMYFMKVNSGPFVKIIQFGVVK